jgi:pectate lyase
MRLGAAFVPSNAIPGATAGNNMGLNGATGGYLSDGRVDPNARIMYVSHDNWANFTVAGLNRTSAWRSNNPAIVRFIGTVGSVVHEGMNTYAQSGGLLPIDARGGNRMMTLNANSHQLTFEGVGPDAILYGWGIFTGGTQNFVFRNLHIEKYFQQGLRASGNGSTNIWVHNNTFHF